MRCGSRGLCRVLDHLSVRTFKSLDDVTAGLGLVNVFIGANGSGKSNLLEALGILSAAADGKVDDQTLLARGVRPGLPALYKSAFPARPGRRIPPHLHFGARSGQAKYEVSLHNPLRDPAPAWRFKTELWEDDDNRLVGRLPVKANRTNPERGLAALKAVEAPAGAARDLLGLLQGYVIFSPATAVLRGVAPKTQPRRPVGLSGGNLPRAIRDLLKQRKRDARSQRICREVLGLVDWAEKFGWTSSDRLPLSPTAAASKGVIRLRDRFMRKDRNVLSGYDASEGALYALFLAVVLNWLGEHECPPRIVLCTPSKSIEAWVLAAVWPENDIARRDDWECRRNPEGQLGALPGHRRFKKRLDDYLHKQSEIEKAWPKVSARLTEAARFEEEFLAAICARISARSSQGSALGYGH